MGEIIVWPKPSTSLPFTGERLTTTYGGQTEIEHLHRYLMAREWCRDKDMLDVASGEGYGATCPGLDMRACKLRNDDTFACSAPPQFEARLTHARRGARSAFRHGNASRPLTPPTNGRSPVTSGTRIVSASLVFKRHRARWAVLRRHAPARGDFRLVVVVHTSKSMELKS
jgi:hypothetical protein